VPQQVSLFRHTAAKLRTEDIVGVQNLILRLTFFRLSKC